MDRGTIVMEMTLHNVFVKPDELSPSLLEGSAMARTDDKPRGEGEFTQTIPRREGRRRKSTDDKPRGEAEFTQTIPRRLSRGAKEEDEVKTKAKPNHYAQ